jgi:hypothetical protein
MRISRWTVILLLAFAVITAAQVPVSKDPMHRVVFENAQLRILDVNIPPSAMSLEHAHDYDIATVSMSNGTNTRIQPRGQQWGATRPPRPLGDATVTEYTGKADSHRIENLGKAPYQLFAVENLRKGGWSPTPAVNAMATKLMTESRAFRIYDVQLARDTSQTSHAHAVPTIAILVSGKVMSDGPDAQAKANAPAAVGLKQLDQPGQWVLIPSGDTHHVVRLGTADARIVEIEVR